MAEEKQQAKSARPSNEPPRGGQVPKSAADVGAETVESESTAGGGTQPAGADDSSTTGAGPSGGGEGGTQA